MELDNTVATQIIYDKTEIPITLELNLKLFRLLTQNDVLMSQVRIRIEQLIEALLSTLGIPGIPGLTFSALSEKTFEDKSDTDSISGKQLLQLSIHEEYCDYPDDLLRGVHSLMETSPLLLASNPAYILSWLEQLFQASNTDEAEVSTRRATEFLGQTCVEILKLRPSVMLALPQVEAYCFRLSTFAEEEKVDLKKTQPEWFLPLLRSILDSGISIADIRKICEVLSSSTALQRSQEDLCEMLIANLIPPHIEIQFPLDYLKELTTGNAQKGPEQFAMLRKEFFEESGMRFPPFRFVAVEELRYPCFAFKLNSLTTLPFVGLKSNQDFLPVTAPGPSKDAIHSENEILNPLNDKVSILVEYQPDNPENTFTARQLDYFLLCFKATLKKHKARFVNLNFVHEQLKLLGSSQPALLELLRSRLSDEQLTHIMRVLVTENVSIRDMHYLFERLLDYLFLSTDPEHNSVLAYPLSRALSPVKTLNNDQGNVVQFLKESMKRTDLLAI